MPVSVRLFSLQDLHVGERAILTLPEGFTVTTEEQQSIQHAGFEVININPEVSLTEASQKYCDISIQFPKVRQSVCFLGTHWWTLKISPLPSKILPPWLSRLNTLGPTVSNHRKYLFFEQDPNDLQEHRIICGYFGFSNFAAKKSSEEKHLQGIKHIFWICASFTLLKKQWYDFDISTIL